MSMTTEEKIQHYQRSIDRSLNDNKRLLHCITILSKLPVTVHHLQVTGIGRTVNALRKIEGGVGDAAKNLVSKWKFMVVNTVVNTDTSDEEDEACVPDVPECYESPDCDSEPETNSARPAEININVPSTTSRTVSTDSSSVVLSKDLPDFPASPDKIITKKEMVSSDNDNDNDENGNDDDDEEDDNDDDTRDEHHGQKSHKSSVDDKHKNRSPKNNKNLSLEFGSKKEKSLNKDSDLTKLSSKDKHSSQRNKHESTRVSKSVKDSEITDHKRKDRVKTKSESSYSSSSSSKEKKHRETTKRKYETSSSDEESNKKKIKLSSEEEEDNQDENNFMINSRSSDEEEEEEDEEIKDHKDDKKRSSNYSKSKESSLKGESHSDKSKSKDKHRSSSSHSKTKSSSDKNKKDDKHATSKLDEHEQENKSKENDNRSKESLKLKTSYSSSSNSNSSKDRSKDHDKDKDKHGKDKTKELSTKSHKDEKEKCRSKDKERKEHKEHKKHKENKDSKEDKEQKEKKKAKKSTDGDGGIDCNSGTSFADALGMCTMLPPSSKKKKENTSLSLPKPTQIEKSNSSSLTTPPSNKASSSKIKSEPPDSPESLPLLSPNIKLEPLRINEEVDLASTLPEPSPNYKPLPQINSAQRRLNEDQMLSQVIYAKNQRTKVFSGNKTGYTNVPTLYEMCIRVLIENIDALEFTGGVPYYIIKPVLERATPDQLFMLEHHNPYLIEESDSLWQFHCNKDFRTKKREEMESWREMYMRCLDEREAKLKTLTANIKQSIDKSLPVRSTKLAYVDNIVKPPRSVLRKQAKYGTANSTSKSSDIKKKIIAAAAAAAAGGSSSSSAERISVPPPPVSRMRMSSTSSAVKKTKAPLMAKALQAIKGRYKR